MSILKKILKENKENLFDLEFKDIKSDFIKLIDNKLKGKYEKIALDYDGDIEKFYSIKGKSVGEYVYKYLDKNFDFKQWLEEIDNCHWCGPVTENAKLEYIIKEMIYNSSDYQCIGLDSMNTFVLE